MSLGTLALLLKLGEHGSHCVEAVVVQGGEQRDMLLGQLFGFGAVVRSGLELDAAAGREIAAGVVQIAEKKSFLREAAGGARQLSPELLHTLVCLAAVVAGLDGGC